MTSLSGHTGLGSIGLLSVVPLLTGCAAAEMESQTPALDSAPPQSEETSAPMDAADAMAPEEMMSGATWKDGTYQASGSYNSPGGRESVNVTITLANNVITDVLVTPASTNSLSVRYQGQFADGIAAETLGKPIDSLSVSRVSGSSLTSGGFHEALDVIKADATR